jgi:ankyrin repeat protein
MATFHNFVVACRNDDIQFVYWLHRENYNLFQTDAEGKTGLIWASFFNSMGIVEFLVRITGGTNIDDGDDFGWTALIWACYHQHLQIALFLCHNGADVNLAENIGYTPLMGICAGGDFEFTRFLCEEMFANVNAATNNGWTALMSASKFGHIPVVQYLTERGANFLALHSGQTAYDIAINNNQVAVAEYLEAQINLH